MLGVFSQEVSRTQTARRMIKKRFKFSESFHSVYSIDKYILPLYEKSVSGVEKEREM
jgi:hypothetical protein